MYIRRTYLYFSVKKLISIDDTSAYEDLHSINLKINFTAS